MRLPTALLLLTGGVLLDGVAATGDVPSPTEETEKITPKVFIVSMFTPEATVWWGISQFNLLAHNISLPGASPLFPNVHCTATHEICQLVTGEGEINAAVSMTSLAFSPLFNLTTTYFLLAGIGGINPQLGTIGGVTFARFAIQVALQREIDLRELPANFSTSYFPQGGDAPYEYPGKIYGTEVFELNDALRSWAVALARHATLDDSSAAREYRANYTTPDGVYAAGTREPSVVECDVATSDVYFSGKLLAESFGRTIDVWTNGTGRYCTTAQEDNASLEALVRAAAAGLVDFARVVVMRTGSDFDRPPPGVNALQHLVYNRQGGHGPAVRNIYQAGIEVVGGIVEGWDEVFGKGVQAGNYVGDILGSLGGEPDYGPA
ncbi:hypothetical protein FE257_010343 [Aspergillus nanangensis]|uniref:Purine nucleoside permease n=1 Tax=Aspergillus nanangensis TaxID=2582783 RepID=A0AAD4CJH0_ASPNN|nr:hypothetical protein FE257_010343 [Aspergillus nanangensis]